jgi:hypothetical protein
MGGAEVDGEHPMSQCGQPPRVPPCPGGDVECEARRQPLEQPGYHWLFEVDQRVTGQVVRVCPLSVACHGVDLGQTLEDLGRQRLQAGSHRRPSGRDLGFSAVR